MTRSLVTLWVTLVAAIVTISVLAQFWISQRERSSEQRVREILLSRLVPFNDSIERIINAYSVDLQREVGDCDLLLADRCVSLTRQPLVASLVVVNADSQLVFPTDVASATKDRQSLYDEAQQLLKEMADPRPPAKPQTISTNEAVNQEATYEDLQSFNSRSYTNRAQQLAEPPGQAAELSQQPDWSSDSLEQPSLSRPPNESSGQEFGWITWYHRRGMVLGFWWTQGTERRAIATIPRGRWMADIVAALPDATPPVNDSESVEAAPSLSGSLNQLIDVEGNVIYQWGDAASEIWPTLEAREADAVMSVVQPLEGWRLRVFATEDLKRNLAGDSFVLPLYLAVLGLSAALVLGGWLVTINFNRQMRLARQRVSFVNQVSHELRTPLTNICMYADLLAASMEGQAAEHPGDLQKIGVIQSESQRLSRLISNVLLFARADSKPTEIHEQAAVVDHVVQEVLAIFEPRLREIGMEIRTELAAAEERSLDPDVVEQILVNLIGNAEKYAAGGKKLEVSTISHGDSVDILVRDFGPGIPNRLAKKIFAPFFRVHDRLEDPTGTGIGLTIVRDLAKKHGGNCMLESGTTPGAAFRCTLLAPRIVSDRPKQSNSDRSP